MTTFLLPQRIKMGDDTLDIETIETKGQEIHVQYKNVYSFAGKLRTFDVTGSDPKMIIAQIKKLGGEIDGAKS